MGNRIKEKHFSKAPPLPLIKAKMPLRVCVYLPNATEPRTSVHQTHTEQHVLNDQLITHLQSFP